MGQNNFRAKEWATLRLGEIISLEYGKGLPEEKRIRGDYPVVGSNGIVGYHKDAFVKGPGIVVGRKGTIGAISWVERDFWAIDTAYYVKTKRNDVFLKWLFYELKHLNLSKLTLSDVVPGLNREFAYSIELRLPEFHEQQKIASILQSMDNTIGKTKELIEKYRKMKQGLMQDFFIKGLAKALDSSTTFQDPKIGILPFGWIIEKLGTIALKIADRDHYTPIYVDYGIPMISPKDFDEFDNISFRNCKYISHSEHMHNRKKTDITMNDLILTRIGANLGKICIVTEEMPEFSILHSAAMIRADDTKISPLFLLYSIRSSYVQKQIFDGVQSIGVPDLGLDKINEILIKYPKDPEEQQKIVDVLLEVDEKIRSEQTYLNKLAEIKIGLMHDLLTGTVRVAA